MKLVFCGTPEFAVPIFQRILDVGHEVALVLSQPDRPAGRKMEIQQSPVKRLAVARGIEVLQPERLKTNDELRLRLEAVRPDAIIVVAYGRIIPQWMLELPRFGNINLHGSLLPKYRGAAPVQWAVANGETETGVTTMLLDAGLDTGAILLEHRLSVAPDATAVELFPQLSHIGAGLMAETLEGLSAGILHPTPQDHSQATLAPILTREDGRMDLTQQTAREAYDRWRGFYPWPGAYAMFRGKRFLVHRMRPGSESGLAASQLGHSAGELLVGAAEGTTLVLDEVQFEGKPRMSGSSFAKGFQLRPGESLE